MKSIRLPRGEIFVKMMLKRSIPMLCTVVFSARRPLILWLLFASMANNEAIRDYPAFVMDGVETNNVSTGNREQERNIVDVIAQPATPPTFKVDNQLKKVMFTGNITQAVCDAPYKQISLKCRMKREIKRIIEHFKFPTMVSNSIGSRHSLFLRFHPSLRLTPFLLLKLSPK